MNNSLTVITITRARVTLLERAIASVRQQDYPGPVEHMIIIDDCANTKAFLERNLTVSDALRWYWMSRSPRKQSVPQRLARLRNRAVQTARTRWISFLDDDNEFEKNHLSSLLACAVETGCQAVHSYRKLFWQDGKPYLEPIWPWCRNMEEAKRTYHQLCTLGVLEPGSNIEKDRCDPWYHPDPVRIVDTGEWLLERELLLRYPFPTKFTYEDWASVTTEDDKLLQCLVANRVPIASTRLPTLKYYLGGYSNSFDALQAPNSVPWVSTKSDTSAVTLQLEENS